MKPKFIQVNCREEINTRNWKQPDYRQAEAVLKYRPDIIIFEQAEKNGSPETVFNKYSPENKPIEKVLAIQKGLRMAAEEPGFGDALSTVKTWENIMQLWREGHNVLIYNVDAPRDLRREFFEVWCHMYPCALKNWLWWVRIYLREVIMAKHVRDISKKYTAKTDPTILICIQSFHWRHVRFLLSGPSKDKIWQYYFSGFKEVSRKNISGKIKKENKIFYMYWKKLSDL